MYFCILNLFLVFLALKNAIFNENGFLIKKNIFLKIEDKGLEFNVITLHQICLYFHNLDNTQLICKENPWCVLL